MRIWGRVVALLCCAVLLLGMTGITVLAATPCYLFEDFEAGDFTNTAVNNVPPSHTGGSSETWSTTSGSDGLYSLQTETLSNSRTNTYLRFQSTGTGNWNNGLTIKSSHLAGKTVYDYTISFDMKVDAWSGYNSNTEAFDHASRIFNIRLGNSPTKAVCLRLEGGYLQGVVGNDAEGGGIENGVIRNLAPVWNVGTGVGDMHNYRLSFRKGASGEGLVDLYIDNERVLDSAKYADVATPLNSSTGEYLSMSAYDNSIGKLITDIRFDNIRLEYAGAPASAKEPFGDGQVRVHNARLINATTTYQGSTVDAMNGTHRCTFTVDNKGAATTMKVIIGAYDENGVMYACKATDIAVAANSTQNCSADLTVSGFGDENAKRSIRAYIWTGNIQPRYEVLSVELSVVDRALAELDTMFNKETQLSWITSLYDKSTGAFFYSASSRDAAKTQPSKYGPHLESTFGSGLPAALQYMDEDAKLAVGRWVQSLQDSATGYFVEPQYKSLVLGNTTNYQNKLGRDLGYALGLLNACGLEPLYLTPSERQQAAAASEVSLFSMTRAVSNAVADNLGSWEAWKAWMDRQSWDEGSVWGTCHTMESNSGLIIAAGYKKQTAEYLVANHIDSTTGMMKRTSGGTYLGGYSYNTISGTLKAMWAFGADSIAYPYIDKLYNNALDLAENQTPGDMAQLINLPVGMQGARKSYAASGTALPAGVDETLESMAPRFIRALTKQLKAYQKPDGCFGYSKSGPQTYSQGVQVSPGTVNEADINGNNALACRARDVLYEFGGVIPEKIYTPQELAERIKIKWIGTFNYGGTHTFAWKQNNGMLPITNWTLK